MTVGHRELDVRLGVDAGQLSPHHELAALHHLIDSDGARWPASRRRWVRIGVVGASRTPLGEHLVEEVEHVDGAG